MKTKNKQRLFLLGKVILFLIALIVVALLVSSVFEWLIPPQKTPIEIAIEGFASLLVGLVVLILFVKVIDKERLFSAGWFSFKNRIKDFFAGGLLGCICISIGFLIIVNVHWNQIEMYPLRINFLLASFFMLLCGAFAEEILFRGYLFRKLLEKFPLIVSLLLSSLVFTLFHFRDGNIFSLAFLNIFLASILLGLLYLKTKNIWFVVGFHFFWNYIQSLLGFEVSGIGLPSIICLNFENMNAFNGGDFGFEGSYVCSIILLLIICFYYKKIRK